MQYKKLWTDMHSNIHHDKIEQLEMWLEHIRRIMDFWPIAYYPFHIRRTPAGAGLEDLYDEEIRNSDWELVRELTRKANETGFPMFMGYEWQGSGKDGDHNVFFLDNEQMMHHPMRYQELRDQYKDVDALGVPHHPAYQPGSRGKNWETHDQDFSPIAEIYSSHGSSENDKGPFPMARHIHMGPRTGITCYEAGLDKGFLCGMIASGDNHSVPGVYEHGSMCVLARDHTKEAIWEALKARRTYGVSCSRIAVDFTVNGRAMGSVTGSGPALLEVDITGTDAIDRVEILKDNVLEEMVVHSGTWEREPFGERIKMKFPVEFGWGPDPKEFPDITSRSWHGSLHVDGKICSIEKCWNSFGQKLSSVKSNSCEFDLTTYKSTTSGKWMGPSNVVTEGFIFEVETTVDGAIVLTVDGNEYRFTARQLLENSGVIPLYQESEALINSRWHDAHHYRDDLIWHNAYKIKIGQAVPVGAYQMKFSRNWNLPEGSNYRLRIWQRNGHVAWTSPVFIQETGDDA